MTKRPSFQFYPSDWRTDPDLRACSLELRGFFIDILCILHEGSPYGYLRLRNKDIHPAELASMIGGITAGKASHLLTSLLARGLLSRVPDDSTDGMAGAILSPRMVRDEQVRQLRAAGGVKSLDNPNVPQPKDRHKDTSKDTLAASFGGSPSSSSPSASTTTSSASSALAADQPAMLQGIAERVAALLKGYRLDADDGLVSSVMGVLGAFGVSYAGDRRITPIVAEIGAASQGLHGPVMSAAEIKQNLTDFLTAPDVQMSGKVLRGFLYHKERDRKTSSAPHSRSNNGAPGQSDALVVEAQQTFQQILSFRVRDERNEYIPAVKVKALGRAAWAAYDTIGGASALLSATGRDNAFLLRDFTRAYVVASQTTTPSPTPENADDATAH